MTYQFTRLTDNPAATLAMSGRDSSFWSFASHKLYWYDGRDWALFATPNGGVSAVAVDAIKNIWAISISDSQIYNFNAVGWAEQSLPAGSAQSLAVGFDGLAWSLDTADKPQVWRFDPASASWVKFGDPSGTAAALVEISSGGTANGLFLAALDSGGGPWRCTDPAGTWQPIPNAGQISGKSIAAGPDGTVFVVDKTGGQIWKWHEGDSSWIQVSGQQSGFTGVSVRADGSLLAVDAAYAIYSGAKTYPSLTGFRGSDWNNAGTTIFAVLRDDSADQGVGCDKIYRSHDGIAFETQPCGSLPPLAKGDYYYYTIDLMIPTVKGGSGPEKMLVSPMGLQSIYLCKDISQQSLTFEKVFEDIDDPGRSGVFHGFAEDSDGNVYAGWYAINSNKNKAILYKSTLADGYEKWLPIKCWEARHIHTVRVNPFNGYLYVVLGEPNGLLEISKSADAARILRSKDGGASWTCLTDTWFNTPVVPSDPSQSDLYLGLYFAGLAFINERVVVGEDTDWQYGRIFYFDDDGRDGEDPAKPLPYHPVTTYTTGNKGEFFFNTASLGNRLYFSSMVLEHTDTVTSTRCVSTVDGVTWRVEQICSYVGAPLTNYNYTLGIFTQHPDRGGALIYSLAPDRSFIVLGQPRIATDPRPKPFSFMAWLRRLIEAFRQKLKRLGL